MVLSGLNIRIYTDRTIRSIIIKYHFSWSKYRLLYLLNRSTRLKKMKYLIVILFVLMSTVGSLEAQVPIGLKGPVAKNYKPWMHKKTNVSMVSFPSKKILKGPVAKNYKPLSSKKERGAAVQIGTAKPKLKAPTAKNYKPWND